MFSHGNEAHRGGTSSSSACARRAWRQCCLAARHRHRFNGWAGEDVWRTPSSILHPGRSWKTMENDGTPGKPMEIHKIGFQMFLCPSHPLRGLCQGFHTLRRRNFFLPEVSPSWKKDRLLGPATETTWSTDLWLDPSCFSTSTLFVRYFGGEDGWTHSYIAVAGPRGLGLLRWCRVLSAARLQ